MRFSATAERELFAGRAEVWAFLAEPRHLSDWWPDVAAVTPDRRGLASGARWTVRRGPQPGLLRRANAESTLLIREVDAPRRAVWRIIEERLDVEISFDAVEAERTLARLTIAGPFVVSFRRSLPKTALARLHALIQTAAAL